MSHLHLTRDQALSLFMVVAFSRFEPSNCDPYFPMGAAGMFRGASIVFFAFVGFDGVATLAEDAKARNRRPPHDKSASTTMAVGRLGT